MLPTIAPPTPDEHQQRLAIGWQNVRQMDFLAHIAAAFNAADVPVMLLKGVAMQLLICDSPDHRPMGDIDLLVPADRVDDAFAVFESIGCRRCQTLLREDFFPRFYYEAELTTGGLFPAVIDMHLRPLRPLRYARLMPDDALWAHAKRVELGPADADNRPYVYVPDPADMLLHLCAHGTIHGTLDGKWGADVRQWVQRFEPSIDWLRLLDQARQWRLVLPVGRGLAMAYANHNRPTMVHDAMVALGDAKTNWRDRLVMWQAPRDENHPTMHVLTSAMTTPSVRDGLAYLRASLLPGRAHMFEWYGRSHPGWLITAHLLRLTRPMLGSWRKLLPSVSRFEVRKNDRGELTAYATRPIQVGQTITTFQCRASNGKPQAVVRYIDDKGDAQPYALLGDVRYVGSSADANARFADRRLVALRRILPDEPITVSPERVANLSDAA